MWAFMNKNINLVGAALIVFCFSTAAYGAINFKLLDSEADTYQHRISVGISSCKERIEKSLVFIKDEEEIDSRYCDINNFEELHKKVNFNIKYKDKFDEFFDNCKELFISGDDRRKAALYLLVDTVDKKFSKFLRLLEKENKIKSTNKNKFSKKTVTSVNQFLNID